MPPPIIALREAALAFGGKPLFDKLSIALAKGERACLVGRNGSGKSTLLKVLAGIHELDRGEFFLQPGTRVSYLPQNPEAEDPNWRTDVTITEHVAGSLGGAFGDGTSDVTALNWFLDVDSLGTFYFEDIGMGPNGPNTVTLDTLILWGQTLAAYNCLPGQCTGRWGVDLFGARVTVPEPGTLALMGVGLLIFALRRRPRRRLAAIT